MYHPLFESDSFFVELSYDSSNAGQFCIYTSEDFSVFSVYGIYVVLKTYLFYFPERHRSSFEKVLHVERFSGNTGPVGDHCKEHRKGCKGNYEHHYTARPWPPPSANMSTDAVRLPKKAARLKKKGPLSTSVLISPCLNISFYCTFLSTTDSFAMGLKLPDTLP